jgi:hypothetical protein
LDPPEDFYPLWEELDPKDLKVPLDPLDPKEHQSTLFNKVLGKERENNYPLLNNKPNQLNHPLLKIPHNDEI